MIRTANPALNANTFAQTHVSMGAETMTVSGTVHRTFILAALALLSAGYTWNLFLTQGMEVIYPWIVGGTIGGLVFALITMVKKTWAPYTAPLYAIAEGFFLGGISSYLDSLYPGVVIQAIGLTIGTLLALLLAYQSGLIRATENFKLGVVAATGGIFVLYLLTFVLGLFGIQMPFIHEGGTVGIIISAVVVVIAALNLVLDFDFIESAANQRAPKYMEWYAAFGLMVTLVWLYIEILRLLTKLQDRN